MNHDGCYQSYPASWRCRLAIIRVHVYRSMRWAMFETAWYGPDQLN
jgi:hypothetical protein